jgi:3-oxoacyl-[acyl-carrier protein] reductase
MWPMYDFNDQRVIVTGGTRGIGKGITQSFLKSGATVIATYASNDEAANRFKEEMIQYGDRLILKKFDVSKATECAAFFQDIEQTVPSIEVLVNNSGIRKDNLTASMTDEEWDRVIDINLKGTFNMSKHATLHMMRNRYGRIINISSIGGALGLPGQANYAASKAGQIAISKTLSKEVAKRKITVNNVAPGFIDTELIADLPEEQVKEYKKQVPMKRFGTVDEVAQAVMFLASREASYITGTTIEVSGGL